MGGTVQPSGRGGSPYPNHLHTAVKERVRAEYNTHTKTFGLKGPGESKKIDHMEQIEGKVANVPVPVDLTSPAAINKLKNKTEAKAKPLDIDTKDVDEFFSGNATFYDNFISSVSEAQKPFNKPGP